ncbi:lamin tail domain-containing protein [Verrucomicrobiaceae bacterium 227]
MILKFRPAIIAIACSLSIAQPAGAAPVINELVAINDNTLDDEDGDNSDWIEIHNPTVGVLDLGGYFLTDDALNPTRWQLPAGTTLAGGGYLIIFASGKDRATVGGEFHTNFNLNSSGEDLRLYASDGNTLISQLIYPSQIADIGYGIDDTDSLRFLAPTPGAPNGTGFEGKVADTKFSLNRGFYDSPQTIAITSATPGAEIRFTTDGSEPTATRGSIYSTPISVTTTTTLRAAAFKTNFLPTNVDTHTYLYLEDVIRQPANPSGAPSQWGNRAADYAMDPDVVDDPAYRDEIIDGLKSIRTLSIVVPNDEFFNNPRGIYANPQNDGRDWEREVSFEFLHPNDALRDTQTNGGIRIHGNGSRSASGQPKHGFRVEFRSEYGSKNLNYKLFPDTNVDEFDSIILRGQNAHGWTRSSQISNSVGTSEREQSQYIRDSFARDIMKDMGQTSGESTYVHLYINGLYWGLYNPVEYPRAAYGASHFGGDAEDYDAINRRTTTTSVIDGTFDAWNQMQALANSGLTTQAKYEEMETHLNIDNLIDYMLMHQYMGSRDGPEVFNSNNMRAIRKSRGENLTTWIGMPWDMEASMFEIDVTRNVNVDDPSTLVRVYNKLRENREFLLRYADHVHRHCFNGGTLTPARVTEIWETRANEIYTAIIGESARWGDYRRANLPFTRDAEWQDERNRLLTTYFPTRNDFVVNLLRENDLYPSTDAPVFSQHGGPIPVDFTLKMTAKEGDIHYTIDGSDPRLVGGAVNPGAGTLSGGSELKSLITLAANDWRYLDTGSDLGGSDVVVDHPSYGPDNWKHPDFDESDWKVGQAMLGYGGISGGTINQLVEFGGVSSNRHLTTHFRKHFNITGATSYRELRIDLRRDDGAIVYLNGHEIIRSNMPEGMVGFQTLSSTSISGSNESVANLFTHQLSPGELLEGDNVLAIEVHQESSGSSDLALDLQLDGLSFNESDGLPLAQSTLVRARTLLSGEWSALTEATFLAGNLASAGNIVISEIMYHPAGAGVEFLELANVSASPVDLSGVHFGDGIDVTIPTGTSIPAGEFFLITNFENGTALSNSGETLTLLAADGSIIESFRYNDKAPWPTSPDGFGPSLTRILPPGPPSTPESWRPSVSPGGSPAVGDSRSFTGDPNADLDRDDLNALLEYAYGTSDTEPDLEANLFTIKQDGTVILTQQRNLAADDIEWSFEHSPDLETWSPASDLSFIGSSDNGNGTVKLKFSSMENDAARNFWRARAVKR